MDEKLVYFGFGALLGAVLIGVYNKNQNDKRISNFMDEKNKAMDVAHENGYVEAHQNLESLLIWAQKNGYSPGQLVPIIRGEQ